MILERLGPLLLPRRDLMALRKLFWLPSSSSSSPDGVVGVADAVEMVTVVKVSDAELEYEEGEIYEAEDKEGREEELEPGQVARVTVLAQSETVTVTMSVSVTVAGAPTRTVVSVTGLAASVAPLEAATPVISPGT